MDREHFVGNTGNQRELVPISQAYLDGYAFNGELYMPPEIEGGLKLSGAELESLSRASYSTIFSTITRRFLCGALDDAEIDQIATEIFDDSGDFDFEDGTLRHVKTPSDITIVSLSDGPTAAFKDMGLQPFARLVEAIQKKLPASITSNFLTATSGDTGPAAQAAFGAVDNTRTFTLFPENDGVSSFQRAQMYGYHDGETTHSIEIDADFSHINDMQRRLELDYDVSVPNSANLGRLLAQVPYHFAAYFKTIDAEGKAFGDPIDVSIPSGNFGNGFSAILAREMGLPIRNIILATNENDALARFFTEKVYPNVPNGKGHKTTASAQDIRNASNWWRFVHLTYGGRNSEIYEDWSKNGSVDLNDFESVRPSYGNDVVARKIGQIARHEMMQQVYGDSHGEIMIDPHTANAVAAAVTERANDGVPVVAYETAKPIKFSETMRTIIGKTPDAPERFKHVMSALRTASVPRLADEQEIRDYLDSHDVPKRDEL